MRKTSKGIRICIILGTIVLSLMGAIATTKVAEAHQEKVQQRQREEALYKHGFRLLEERIAIYTKDHYEGISKIEFSPIFEEGGDGFSTYTLNMVPVLYDNYGNRAVLGGEIGRVQHKAYGIYGELKLGLDINDNERIVLKNLDTGDEIDLSKFKHLPKEAEVETYTDFDENVADLVKVGQLKGVKQSSKGSPNAKVIYNTEIRKGIYTKWH